MRSNRFIRPYMVLLLTWVSCGLALAQPNMRGPQEGSLLGTYLRPGLGDFDVYKDGFGIELQYRNWLWDIHGVGLSLGTERWRSASDSRDWGTQADGHLNLISVGLSWLLLIHESASHVWTAEAGVRFHFADSDMRILVWDRWRDVKVGNGLTGLLGLGYEVRISESWSILTGVNYQPDLVPSDASFEGNKLRDNKLEAWGFQVGLRVRR